MHSLALRVAALAALSVASLSAQRGDSSGIRWTYLLENYDKNSDGEITAEEYARGARAFKNLDRDGDGTITESDFERRSRGRRGKRGKGLDPAEVGRRFVDWFGSFIDVDGDPGINLAEWNRAIEKIGPDDDGLIELGDLIKLAGDGVNEAMVGMAAGYVSGRSRGLDLDDDGDITVDEMRLVFNALDQNGDGKISSGDEVKLPPAIGAVAPDWTLALSSDASQKVTLSSFRGKKPVAMIFGSYT